MRRTVLMLFAMVCSIAIHAQIFVKYDPIFQSTGKATQSFVTAVARPFLFLLPVIFILPRFLQLDGVWLAFPISDVLTGILTLILLIPQIRELRRKDIFTGGEAIIGVR